MSKSKTTTIEVRGNPVTVLSDQEGNYISLTGTNRASVMARTSS